MQKNMELDERTILKKIGGGTVEINEKLLATDLKGSERHIAITINNYCNNTCGYCTRPLFNSNEFDTEKFRELISWLKQDGIKRVLILGGEPTLHSKFSEILEILKENKIICTVLSNGRFGKTDFFKYFGKVIKQITLHLPTLKDNQRDEWGKDVEKNIIKLKEYMKNNDVHIPIGLGNVVDHADWEWRILLKVADRHNLKHIGMCMAHPTDEHRINPYASYAARVKAMPEILDAFKGFDKLNKKIHLDFFMPCLVDDALKSVPQKEKDYFMKVFEKSYSPQLMYELNFMHDGAVEIGNCLIKGNNILTIPNYMPFKSIEKLEEHIEGKFRELAKEKEWPNKCLGCKYFNKTCKGDHLNLISEYEEKKALPGSKLMSGC